jgi:hypothetical protein
MYNKWRKRSTAQLGNMRHDLCLIRKAFVRQAGLLAYDCIIIAAGFEAVGTSGCFYFGYTLQMSLQKRY